MDIDRIVELVIARLFTLARAKSGSDSSGRGQVEGIADEAPPCQHAALPGFSSGIAADDELLVIRRRSGAVSIAAFSRPPGEQSRDRTIWNSDGVMFRMRGKVVEISGTTGTDGIKLDGSTAVARVGDMVSAATNEAAFQTAVAGLLMLTPPTDFGTIATGSSKVKAG